MLKRNRDNETALKISRTMKAKFPRGIPAKDGVIHRSKRRGAVEKVHELYARIVRRDGGTRRDLLKATRKRGIADHTAIRQYNVARDPKKYGTKRKAA